MDELEGRVAVVTGGASGIGKAMAARFVAEGMRVVIADVEVATLEAAADELGVVGVVTDVSDAESVASLADTTMDRFGRVDLLCNNAGVGGGGHLVDLDLRDWQWVLGVNLWGVIHGIHAFLPHLLANESGGHVVNTASMAGLTGYAGLAPYSATKFAVVGLSEALRDELLQRGADVGVTVLCPGFVRTNIFSSERNRPASLLVPGRANRDAEAGREEIQRLLDDIGIPPEVVADAVVDGVRKRQFWVFTHPEMLDPLDQRHAALLAHRR